MKVSLQWLNNYADFSALTIEQIADALPMLGLEVEGITKAGLLPLKNVVIGEILSFEKHANSDHLSVCQVNTGDTTPRQIVCGAKNFKANDRVPVALPGAVLPGGFEIKESKLRGVDSLGMMCSARELGLGDDHGGLLILTARNLPVGTSINDHFPKPDTVFEISVTANRGDALSHIGVARDLAAFFNLKRAVGGSGFLQAVEAAGRSDNPDAHLAVHGADCPTPRRPTACESRPDSTALSRLNLPLTPPALKPTRTTGDVPLTSVFVSSPAAPYYTAQSIRGVKIGPSPDWLKRDLEAVGQRPINNVVDITNWVMLETGQPLHAFDAAKIAGAALNIRPALAGEKITLLDGKVVALEESDTVIADAQKPLVIAGIMGGEECGVSDATTDIVLEAAWFSPGAVRKTSRRIAVSTDSSQRFTRDVDPGLTQFAATRAAELIVELAGGQLSGEPVIVGAPPRGDRVIEISGDYVRQRCGYEIADAVILDVFKRLGFSCSSRSTENPNCETNEFNTGKIACATNDTDRIVCATNDTDKIACACATSWRVTVPSFRPEVDRPIDLVEEFVRIHGTSGIPSAAIAAPNTPATDAPVTFFTRKTTALLAGRGFAECWHYTLTDGATIARFHGQALAEALALANPLASDQSHVRPSLLPNLLNALKLNLAGHTQPRRLFEIGRVFRPGRDGALRELIAVSFVALAEPVAPPWKKRESLDFFYAKQLAFDITAAAGLVPQRLSFRAQQVDAQNTFWQPGHYGLAKDRAGHAEIACGLVDAAVAREWDIKSVVVAGEVLFTQENFANAPKRPRFQDWSAFPPVSRDVALIVDAALPAADVLDKIRGAASKAAGKDFALENVACFDVYTGTGLPDGKKSLAYTITFRAPDKTLTDDVVNRAFEQTIATLEKTTGWQVRKG